LPVVDVEVWANVSMKMSFKLFVGTLALATALRAHGQAPDVGVKLWAFTTGNVVQSSPAIGPDGTIYIGSDNGKLYALTGEGTVRWEFSTGGNVISSPALGPDGVVYFGSVDRNVYAVSPEGKEVWHYNTGSGIVSSPALGADGNIYIGTVFNKVLAISASGALRWEFAAGGNVATSPAVAADGTIYVGAFNDKLYALTPGGAKKWDFTAGNKIYSSAAIGADGTVYFGSLDYKLYALNPNGTKKWEFTTGSAVRSSPVVGPDGTIYVGSDDRKLYAVNPDGSRKWAYTTGYWVRSAAAVAKDGTVYFGSYDNFFYALNPDGSRKWEFPTGFYISSSPAIDANGTVYVGSWDRSFSAFKGSSPAATEGWPVFRGNLAHTGRSGTPYFAQAARAPKPTPAAPAATSPIPRSEPAPASKPEGTGPTTSVLSLQIVGSGRITPALGGQTLELGRTYSMKAEPVRDSQFTGWTGSLTSSSPSITFVMQPNLVLQATFAARTDHTRPAVAFVSPADGTHIPNPIFSIRGTATDNTGVARVEYQVDNEDFKPAEGTNSWQIRMNSKPGTMTVRVKAIDLAGNESSVATRTFQHTLMNSITMQVIGRGALVPNLSGRMLELGKTYTVVAEPAKDHVFLGWSGAVTTNSPRLSFVMESNTVITARFAPLAFAAGRGAFSGLFKEESGLDPETTGFIRLNADAIGNYTGVVMLSGTSHSLTGKFDARGYAQHEVPRRGKPPVTLLLRVDLAGNSDQMTGEVSDGTFKAALLADRSPYDAKTQPSPLAGRYTLILPGGTNALTSPAGDGFGTVIIDAAGNLKLNGELADGTPIAQEASVSRDGLWPLYASLYGGKGLLIGWLKFNPSGANDIVGTVTWIKPGMSGEKYYPQGFVATFSALGSVYTPAARAPESAIADGLTGLLRGGNLEEAVLNGEDLKLSITSATGILSGNFIHPQTGKSTSFKGVYLQKQNWRSGYFLGPSESGCLFLSAGR
jgi:outer membrane protein assembly factor BamB